MATAKAPTTKKQAEALLQLLDEIGDVTEVRFLLRQVKLDDGRYHALKKPVTVKVQWATEYFVAVDNRTTFAGAGDTPADALREYLKDWRDDLQMLQEDEHVLGPALQADLKKLSALLGLSPKHAH